MAVPGTNARLLPGGGIEVLRWLREEGGPWNTDACRGASEGRNLESLKRLREGTRGVALAGCCKPVSTRGGQSGLLDGSDERAAKMSLA